MSESPIRVGADYDADADGSAPVDIFAPPRLDEISAESAMEGLRKALAAPVERKSTTVNVLERPGVSIRCHTNMSHEQRKAWQNRSKKKTRGIGREPEVDEMMFACLVIANTTVAVQFGGVDAHDEEGTPLTFAHKQLWEMVNATDPQDAIRKLFAVDAHVLIASGEVMLASGFDDDLAADPTQG